MGLDGLCQLVRHGPGLWLVFLVASRGDLTGFTSLTFLTPVFALASGLVLLGEQLEPLQWLGVVLALASVLLINRRADLWQA